MAKVSFFPLRFSANHHLSTRLKPNHCSSAPGSGIRRRARIFVLALAAVLGGCDFQKSAHDQFWFDPVRYRLTAEVETPTGIKSGSSVIETVYDRGLSGFKVRGEAVAVDIAPGQTLFVLLRSPTNVDWAAGLPGIPMIEKGVPAGSHDARAAQMERQLAAARAGREEHYLWGGDAPVTGAQYLPYFVRFRDTNKSETVEQVDGADLEKTFGAHFRLKSLRTQVTSDPITNEIKDRLTWLGKYPEPHLAAIPGGGVSQPTLAQFLTHGDFIKGDQE